MLGQSLSDGATPTPGGWNRVQLVVVDLESALGNVTRAGAETRGAVIEGRGGKQALVVDPSGKLIELFEAYRPTPLLAGTPALRVPTCPAYRGCPGL